MLFDVDRPAIGAILTNYDVFVNQELQHVIAARKRELLVFTAHSDRRRHPKGMMVMHLGLVVISRPRMQEVSPTKTYPMVYQDTPSLSYNYKKRVSLYPSCRIIY